MTNGSYNLLRQCSSNPVVSTETTQTSSQAYASLPPNEDTVEGQVPVSILWDDIREVSY